MPAIFLTDEVIKLFKLIEVNEEQLLNINEVSVTKEESKLLKSISVRLPKPLNIFLQLFILSFHSNLIIKSILGKSIALVGVPSTKFSFKYILSGYPPL